MAIHTTFLAAAAPATSWSAADFVAIVEVGRGEVVILGADGGETRLTSNLGDFRKTAAGVSGTVTSMARTGVDGATTYEVVDGLSISVRDLLAAGGRRFDLILEGAARIWSLPVEDDLAGPTIGEWPSPYQPDSYFDGLAPGAPHSSGDWLPASWQSGALGAGGSGYLAVDAYVQPLLGSGDFGQSAAGIWGSTPPSSADFQLAL